MQKQAAFLIVAVLLLGLILMRESREGVGESREGAGARIETGFGDWLADNTTRSVPPAPVTLVEINESSLASSRESAWPWSPADYVLFMQKALPYKPDVVSIAPVLDWQGVTFPPVLQQLMEPTREDLNRYISAAPKVVLASLLGSPEDPDKVPPLQPVPLLRNVTGEIQAVPAFTDIAEKADADYPISATVGFTNFPSRPGEIIRKAPLLFNYRDEIVPSFILETLIRWFKLTPDDVKVEMGERIVLGKAAVIPIDLAGRMNVDFGATFTRFGEDKLVIAASDKQGTAPAIAIDAIKGSIVILARTDTDSRTLVVPSLARESYGEICAAAIATVLNRAYSRRVSVLFDFAVIALMMAPACFFHRFRKRTFALISFMALLFYLFLAMSVYALSLVRLPIILPAGLLLLVNFFNYFIPRDTPAPAAAPGQPS